ncbi:MAG: hypothetical protein ACI4PG_01975 [Candidatus Ventricola sp.]
MLKTDALASLRAWAQRHAAALCVLLSALLTAALAAHNVSAGPLRNLNDIGGWGNRALMIAVTAALHAAVLLAATALFRVGVARRALRLGILTAGLYILLLPINQKTYAFVQVTLPLIRAMEAEGLAAAAGSGLSAPAAALLYAVTRGPIYPMYTLKLLCIGCLLLTVILLTRAADRRGLGIRAEALLTLCVILPQGLMNAACSALPELPALALLALALTLLDEKRPLAGALCYGAACALCGACLYALAMLLWMPAKGRLRPAHLAAAALPALALCVPAVACGMPAARALGSLLSANLNLPAYASGAPNIMSLIPRAIVEETPQYAPMLRHLAELDTVTNAQEYYTQTHFVLVMRGLVLAGLAMLLGLAAWLRTRREMDGFARTFALTLGALLVCPGVTSGAWLAIDLLCLWAIVAKPALRLSACLVLFATAGASCYPMTEEVLLPMVAAFLLCLLALLVVLGIVPGGREKEL